VVSLLSPSFSIGFSPAFDLALPRLATQHAAETSFSVASCLDRSLRLDDFAYPPCLRSGVRPRVRAFLNSVAPGRRILAVHTETKPGKRWPTKRWSLVLGEILKRHPCFSVFILDFHKPTIGLTEFRDRVIHSRGLPLSYALAVVEQSNLFIGIDSCMLHAADLFRIPGVGLFGPTDAGKWGFRFSPHRHVSNARGMIHIQESTVLEALESIMA